MNIEEVKHLFVPVEDRFPLVNKDVLCLTKDGRQIFTYAFRSEEGVCFDNEQMEDDDEVTHWLDLSILTTKDRAKEVAWTAYKEAFLKPRVFVDDFIIMEEYGKFMQKNHSDIL